MPKFLFLFVSVCLATSARAEGMRFSLNCTPDKGVSHVPAHIAKYKVVKIATKSSASAKWITKYALQVFFKSQPSKAYEYPLVPAGSGDEDYSEYNVKGTGAQIKTINVTAAYIQNQFGWVNLIDTNGMGFADCR